MKRILINKIIVIIIALQPLFAVAQPPVKAKGKVILDESANSILKQLQPILLQDTQLTRKGYTLYRGDAFDKAIRIPVDKMKKFTLRELNEREKNCGYIPLQSPLFFQRNTGQTIGAYRFLLQNLSSTACFTNNGLTAYIQAPSRGNLSDEQPENRRVQQLSLEFRGATGELTPRRKIDAPIRYIKGNERNRRNLSVEGYNYLVQQSIYPGIDLAYQAKLGRLEYQFMMAPNSDIRLIRIRVKGAEKLAIDKKGNLIIQMTGGNVAQTSPRFFEVSGSNRTSVTGSYVLLSKNEYGFRVNRINRAAKLIIDPEIVFTSYYGGSANDAMLGADLGSQDFIGKGYDVKTGPDGDIYIVGKTFSPDFFTTLDQTAALNASGGDGFVLRIDPSLPTGSNLVYATIFGGSSEDNARSIDVLSDGSAYVTGFTGSSDFPTSSGVVQPVRQSSGAFILKLLPDGNLSIGSFIGNKRSNHPNSIVIGKSSLESEPFIYVGGSARDGSGSDATDGSFQQAHQAGGFDGFVVKMPLDLSSYTYFSYLGGAGRDVIMDIDVQDGFLFATGTTGSVDFPVTDVAFRQHHTESSCNGTLSTGSCAEAFVTRFKRDGSGLVYSTYLGEPGKEDYARGIAVNSNKQAFITGASATPGSNRSDIFVAKMEAGGENVLWKTVIPGIARDHGEELVVDRFDRVYVTGTISEDGHSTGFGADTYHGGTSDMFFCRMNGNGETEFFGYLGGSGEDRGFAITASGNSENEFCATIVGSTVSDDIETINPIAGGETLNGNADLLIYTLCNASFTPNASSFTKTAPSFVQRGDNISYTITLVNDADNAVPVTVTDNVPAEITVTGVSGTGCTRTGNSVTCSFQAQPGATAIVISGTVKPSPDPNNCRVVNTVNNATLRVGRNSFTASAITQLTCKPRPCGNGRLDPGEECDGTPGCRNDCTRMRCGDGILDPGEDCDNNNSNCVNCRKILRPGDECGSGITGRCPSGTTCKTQCFVIECEYDIWNLWGILADDNCGDLLCRTYKECVPN